MQGAVNVSWVLAALLTVASPLQAEDLSKYDPPQLAVMDPLQFLDYLKTSDEPMGVVTISQPKRGWIKPHHIPKLIALLDSKEPCAPVVDVHSSSFPRRSTIGKEAAFMIASFRDGMYPSALSAGAARAATPDELRAWWDEQLDKGVLPPLTSGKRSP